MLDGTVGTFAGVHYVVGEHTGEVKKLIPKIMICFLLGNVDPTMDFQSFVTSETVAPGCIFYPRYRVWDRVYAVRNIQVHDLMCEVRMGTRNAAEGTSWRHRGAWALFDKRKGRKAKLYGRGSAVCDWK